MSLRIALTLIFACIMSSARAQPEPEAVYPLERLVSALDSTGGAWLPFLTVPTLQTGLYRLPAGAEDRQSPHDRDEVYFVLEGTAQIRIGDTSHAIKAGDTIFVQAAAEHRFFEIEEDLLLLVFFSEAAP